MKRRSEIRVHNDCSKSDIDPKWIDVAMHLEFTTLGSFSKLTSVSEGFNKKKLIGLYEKTEKASFDFS